MAMSPGTIVGGYRIQRILGAGGMGTVYLAQHPSLPRMDALKVLSSELSRDPEFRARFEREANLAAGLDHPNIVSVYNRGEEHGQLWIAMQYVDGTDASAELARDPHAMTPLRALRIVTEVGRGLDYAHRKGLLHRDIKPANFLLSSRDGEEERVFLTDFGVAKSTEDVNELTQTGGFLATIAYAPPEQLAGSALDHRGDIYSLGCSLFKLLTGQNPYPAAQPAMVMMGHLYEPPPRATAVRPGLPPAIDAVFQRVLAKNPAERYGSCREFTDAAADALVSGRHPVSTNTSPTRPIRVFDPRSGTDPRISLSAPPGRRRKRWPLVAGLGTVVIVLAAAGIVWATGDQGSSPTPPAASATATRPPAAVSVAQARANNPAFEGKPIAMVDVTTGDEYDPAVAVYLSPSPQTDFLGRLGLYYNPGFTKHGDEPSPRRVGKDDRYATFTKNLTGGYLIAVRSDPKAGNGGQLGLPAYLSSVRAEVIVVDDPGLIAALRNWSDGSEQVVLEKLVPILRDHIK
ncbi:protein kinase [Nocardia sp. CDC159]|uniref:non-specific serine/threonine protein kinase n=1 Tax=Nocardia pulmonis TaxID=2951408 RepID=A0A9X2E9H5_9NOCA|nr:MULTISPECIES: serine/threonine-protein kinase [Nocardia]MCM6776136.1 protein kinase [Nocardia pulmonis]MCM6788537.1 protein kinase [Nocardia sp. CDC159]